MTAPDVLVLGGGGILGEAWMSAVLAGLDHAGAFDARDCDRYVGTSAGSIVAAALAAGVHPGVRLGTLPEQPPLSGKEGTRGPTRLRQALDRAIAVGGAAAAPAVSAAFGASAAGGALVRRAALARVPAGRRSLAALGREVERLGLGWDGRLRIAAVELESGRRVVLGAPAAPEMSVAQAVQASCAIPGVFTPVAVNGHRYVDGGAWSPTNMDAADAGRGDRVVCLNPTGSLRPSIAEPAGAIGPVSRSAAAAEALVLSRRGAKVRTVNPDRESLAAMGPNLMDPRPRSRVIAAGVSQGRRLGREWEPT